VLISPGVDVSGVPVFSDLVSLQYIRPEPGGELLFGNSDLRELEFAAPDHYVNRSGEAFLELAADQVGYPGILGYQGPVLSEVTDGSVTPLGEVIESMMVRKSAAGVALIRQSARWCEHAHRLLQQYTRPGATEAEASLRAGHEATLAMLQELGDCGQQGSSDGVSAGYRGQIGLLSAWAHAVAHNIEFKAGDVLVTDA